MKNSKPENQISRDAFDVAQFFLLCGRYSSPGHFFFFSYTARFIDPAAETQPEVFDRSVRRGLRQHNARVFEEHLLRRGPSGDQDRQESSQEHLRSVQPCPCAQCRLAATADVAVGEFDRAEFPNISRFFRGGTFTAQVQLGMYSTNQIKRSLVGSTAVLGTADGSRGVCLLCI